MTNSVRGAGGPGEARQPSACIRCFLGMQGIEEGTRSLWHQHSLFECYGDGSPLGHHGVLVLGSGIFAGMFLHTGGKDARYLMIFLIYTVPHGNV